MKKSFIKSIKELLRISLIAMIPAIYLSINVQTGEFAINWPIVSALGTVAILKSIDKALHEIGKETGRNFLVKGLTRF